ncbi:hypothetical protein E4J93_05860 [Collinsella sp. BA40]|uniref:hypothetical protein n=1 Tax=Collinsella sp. BA40 TaxID=2560852 RepID=UPI0011CC672E|nr:hypothetical protein [Collinsella sp. BA40]TXF35899.1 hypothetical protein E4J93_05860 [Collinsella sp. BA40]
MGNVRVIEASDLVDSISFYAVWRKINELYQEDPVHAVRSQELIKTLHHKLAIDLYKHLSIKAKNEGIRVIEEAPIYGSYKRKNVDIAVVDPNNGPLITVGVRSQMSSVGKNVLTYYQDIIGECISLQERFPMTAMGYVYLHPLHFMDKDKEQRTDVERYAQLYSSIADRDDRLYKNQLGVYDQFAYAVVDFNSDAPMLRDDIVQSRVADIDLSITTFVDRLVQTFVNRNIWLDDLFVVNNG